MGRTGCFYRADWAIFSTGGAKHSRSNRVQLLDMPLDIHQEPDSDITTVRASGTLEKSDYQNFATVFETLVRHHGKLRVLFDMTALDGWKTGAVWNEIRFDAEHFKDIERLAAVGQSAWKQGLTAFAQPFTKAEIRYFDATESAAARTWLTTDEPSFSALGRNA